MARCEKPFWAPARNTSPRRRDSRAAAFPCAAIQHVTHDREEPAILAYAERPITEGYPPGVPMIDDNRQEGHGVWKSHRALPRPESDDRAPACARIPGHVAGLSFRLAGLDGLPATAQNGRARVGGRREAPSSPNGGKASAVFSTSRNPRDATGSGDGYGIGKPDTAWTVSSSSRAT